MKRIVVAVMIPIVSIAIGLSSFFFVKNTCNQVVSGLDEVLDNLLTEDVEEVNRLTVQTNRNWHKKVFLLNIFIGRTGTNEVDKLLSKIVYFSDYRYFVAIFFKLHFMKQPCLFENLAYADFLHNFMLTISLIFIS